MNLLNRPAGLVFGFVFGLLFSTILPKTAQSQDGNSNEIIRVKPNELARKIGAAVDWQPDLKTAMELAKQVFWYVPTLPDTFMDRKIEVHRYMMAGPFSWPAIIESLNENAICVKSTPSLKQQKQYGLQRYKFVEPGFIVLDSDGAKQSHIDQLTTLQPDWLLSLFERSLDVTSRHKLHSSTTQSIWNDIAVRRFSAATLQAKKMLSANRIENPDAYLEIEFARGVAAFCSRKQAAARKIWSEAANKYPDSPLAWKMAAEVQGIGPFVRGFETFSKLPSSAYKAGIASRGSAAPENVYDVTSLRERSVDFLLSMQNDDGGFYDSDYDFGGSDSLKNVHVAVSSLTGMALLKHFDTLEAANGNPSAAKRGERMKKSIDSVIRFVSDDKHLNKKDRDEILWAYAFRLRFLLGCKEWLINDGQSGVNAELNYSVLVKKCIESLESIQTNRGGWYHEYANPFVTANALLALHEAKSLGFQIDESRLAKGITSLLNDRFKDGSYPYGTSRRKNSDRNGGPEKTIASAGRMPLCELALLRLGKSDEAKLLHAVETSFEYHDAMAKAYKYDNHTDNYIYGGFFFWYDMRSRSEAIQSIADPAKRGEFRRRQKQLVISLPEVDGCFVDSHELGRVYGTSMALICLDMLEQ